MYNRHFLGGRKRRVAFRASERPIKPLHNGKTWKELFRVAYNWSTGNARTTQLSLRSAVLPRAPHSMAIEGESTTEDEEIAHSSVNSHSREWSESDRPERSFGRTSCSSARIAWHGDYYFAAARKSGKQSPCISIFKAGSDVALDRMSSKGLCETAAHEGLAISDLCLDEKQSCESDDLRLVAFYTSGQYSIFRLRNLRSTSGTPISWEEEYFSSQRSSKAVVSAKLHSPLLVTSTRDCAVRFRLLEQHKTSTGAEELHVSLSQPTMRSHMCFAPMAMRLEPIGAIAGKAVQDFRVSLAYSTPYYPASFTVGMQMFDVHIPSGKLAEGRTQRVRILARNAVAVPPSIPSSPARSTSATDDEDSTPTASDPQAIVTSIQHDGSYVVTSKSDNTISVYKIYDAQPPVGNQARSNSSETLHDEPSSPARMLARPLRIRHVRTLFGHTAGVDAVNVADGRCVSTGRDGLKVWELPAVEPDGSGWGVAENSSLDMTDEDAVWQPNVSVIASDRTEQYEGRSRCSWIGLDSSKIVTICGAEGGEADSVKVYDFQ